MGEVLSTLAGSVGGQGLQLVAREGCMGMMMMGVEWEEWLGETFFLLFSFERINKKGREGNECLLTLL